MLPERRIAGCLAHFRNRSYLNRRPDYWYSSGYLLGLLLLLVLLELLVLLVVDVRLTTSR